MNKPEVDNPGRRAFFKRAAILSVTAPIAGSGLRLLEPAQPIQAAGFKQMWAPEINTYYPGDPKVAKDLGMRMITASNSGVASLDRMSTIISREIYGIEAVFDNLGWYRDFENQYLVGLKERLYRSELSEEEYEAKRRAFGLCHARTAWAVRDGWPVREPGETMFDIPGLVAPSFWRMVDMKVLGFAPVAFYFKTANKEANRTYFRDRALASGGDVGSGCMADIKEGEIGEWWGHVANIEQRGNSYRYYVSRAGEPYKWYPEEAIEWVIEPVEYSDLDNPPSQRAGWTLRKDNANQYRSPYYYSPFVRAIYYNEPLPDREHLIAFLTQNQIDYQLP